MMIIICRFCGKPFEWTRYPKSRGWIPTICGEYVDGYWIPTKSCKNKRNKINKEKHYKGVEELEKWLEDLWRKYNEKRNQNLQ